MDRVKYFSLAVLFCSALLILGMGANARASSDWTKVWEDTPHWENGSYDKARVHEGVVDIGIYPPEPRFEGSSWTFSKIYDNGMDDGLEYKREEGEAYFQALDVGDDRAGNDYGKALVYALDNFYLDSAGVGRETLEFGWRAKPNGYDNTYDNTSLRIQLRKPGDSSWINLWVKEYTSFGGTESGTETIWMSSELEYSGVYELRILVYWQCQAGYDESDEFEWYVDNLSFGFEEASHTTQWQDTGSTSSWGELGATANIGLPENILASVEVSDDKSNVKDSTELALEDGSKVFLISNLENARYVRIVSDLYGGLNHSPGIEKYRITTSVPQYDLSVSSSPVEGGSVSLDPSGGTYDEGTTVTLTADSASGYEFDNWSGDVSGTSTSVDVTMDSDKSVTANFSSLVEQYDLSVSSSPVEGGSVSLDPSGGTYENGTVVTLTADSASGYEFDNWSGDVSGTSTSVDVTMDSDKTAVAHFSPIVEIDRPDLIIKRVVLDKGMHLVGYSIANVGERVAVAPHDSVLRVDGKRVDSEEVDVNLDPGEAETRWFMGYYWDGSKIEVKVCTDENQDVKESNENNNCITDECSSETTSLPQIDIDGDAKVGSKDLSVLGESYGLSENDLDFNYVADFNEDKQVDFKDLAILGANYGEKFSKPISFGGVTTQVENKFELKVEAQGGENWGSVRRNPARNITTYMTRSPGRGIEEIPSLPSDENKRIKQGKEVALDFLSRNKDRLGIRKTSEFKIDRTTEIKRTRREGENKRSEIVIVGHQEYDNVPVFGSRRVIHVDRCERVTRIRNNWYPNVDTPTEPTISESEVETLVKEHYGTSRANISKSPWLTILPRRNILAWKVELGRPLYKRAFFNAVSGDFVFDEDILWEGGMSGNLGSIQDGVRAEDTSAPKNEPKMSNGGDGSGTSDPWISGQVFYYPSGDNGADEPDENGLPDVKVSLLRGGNVLATDDTGPYGGFYLPYSGNLPTTIRAELKNDHFEIKNASAGDNIISVENNVISPDNWHEIHFTDTRAQKEGACAFRELNRGRDYLKELDYPAPDIPVYIHPTTRADSVYLHSSEIHYYKGAATLPSDTILHEYGHAVMFEDMYSGAWWGDDTPGLCPHECGVHEPKEGCPTYFIDEDTGDKYHDCPGHGWTRTHCTRQALEEGWATYFAWSVYDKSPLSWAPNYPNSSSGSWLEKNAFLGKKIPRSVHHTLWDLLDGKSDEDEDHIDLSHEEVFSVMMDDCPRSVKDLYETLCLEYRWKKAELWEVFSSKAGFESHNYLGQEPEGGNELGDNFGEAVASGDFDGDGRQDLAVGAPGEAPWDQPKSGGVFLFDGRTSPSKTSPFKGIGKSTAFLDQDPCLGLLEANQEGDEFGKALAVGDFNDDGADDLAVGAPGNAPWKDPKSGSVFVFPGEPEEGIDPDEEPVFLDQEPKNKDTYNNDHGDKFGSSLTTGDFDGDGYDDLAVGAPGIGNENGGVFVFYGTWDDFEEDPDFLEGGVKQGTTTKVSSEAGDEFGSALAVGDFDSDSYDDLAVGAPSRASPSNWDVGRFYQYPGSSSGLDQNNIRLKDGKDIGDEFGKSLAAGDINGDGNDDLVVGDPGDGGGDVHLFYHKAPFYVPLPVTYYGTTYSKSSFGDIKFESVISQDNFDLTNREGGDRFGASLAVGDLNADGFDDLAIGSPGEDWNSEGEDDTGLVSFVPGSNQGLKIVENAHYYHEGSSGSYGAKYSDENITPLGCSVTIADGDEYGSNFLAAGAKNGGGEPASPEGDLGENGGGVWLYPMGPTGFIDKNPPQWSIIHDLVLEKYEPGTDSLVVEIKYAPYEQYWGDTNQVIESGIAKGGCELYKLSNLFNVFNEEAWKIVGKVEGEYPLSKPEFQMDFYDFDTVFIDISPELETGVYALNLWFEDAAGNRKTDTQLIVVEE